MIEEDTTWIRWWFTVSIQDKKVTFSVFAKTYDQALVKLAEQICEATNVDLEEMEGELNPVKPLAIPCRHKLHLSIKREEATGWKPLFMGLLKSARRS